MNEEDFKREEQRFKEAVIDKLFAGAIVDAFPELDFVERPAGGWQSKHHLDGSVDSQGKFITVVGDDAKFNVHDYARGDRGIIDLFMDLNNIDYKEARQRLSRITNVPLPEGEGGGGTGHSDTELAKQTSRIGAAKVFKSALWSGTDEATKALDYLRNDRGLNDEQIEKMGIGLITREILNTLDKNTQGECKYFSRKGIAIVWPYTTGGKIAGFKFREIYKKQSDDDKVFLNSIGLPKGGPLFNIKPRQNVAIVVESELDALLAEISGIDNVVATAGGHLNKTQIEDARRKGVKQFILFFDNDNDERKGPAYTKKSIDLINDDDNVKVVTDLPEGIKDLGEYLQRYSVEGLTQIINNAKSAFAYKFKNEIPADQMTAAEQFYRAEKDRRRIEAEAKNLADKAKQLIEDGQVDEGLAEMEKAKSLRTHAREKEFEKIFANPTVGDIRKMLSHLNKGLPTGIRFGDKPLQETLTLNPGLTFICGNTGHGKTSVLNNIALNEAKRNVESGNGKKVLYFSYEINKTRLILDLLNTYVDNPSISRSPYNSILSYYQPEPGKEPDAGFHDYSREPRLEDRDPNKKRQNYEDFIKKEGVFLNGFIESGAITIVEENYTVESLLDAIAFAVGRNSVSLICIDYAQLIYSETYSRQRTEEIKKIVQDIKDFADEKQIPIVLAAQFNQQVKTPANVKLTNIGEGGDYSRIADTVVGIFNLERFDLDVMESTEPLNPVHKFGIQTYDDCKGKMFLRLLKRRYGISELDAVIEWRGGSKKIVPNYPGDLNVDAIQASLQLTEGDEDNRKADEADRERTRSAF